MLTMGAYKSTMHPTYNARLMMMMMMRLLLLLLLLLLLTMIICCKFIMYTKTLPACSKKNCNAHKNPPTPKWEIISTVTWNLNISAHQHETALTKPLAQPDDQSPCVRWLSIEDLRRKCAQHAGARGPSHHAPQAAVLWSLRRRAEGLRAPPVRRLLPTSLIWGFQYGLPVCTC